jgi:GGDEF domain-containing protein
MTAQPEMERRRITSEREVLHVEKPELDVAQALRWQWWPIWVMLVLPVPFFAAMGAPDDWLRHGVFVILALSCWAAWRGQPDFSVMVFLMSLIPLAHWHATDATSAFHLASLGAVGFGFLAGLGVYGLGAYFGRRFAGAGLVLAAVCLGFQSGLSAWNQLPMAGFVLLVMAVMGVHQRRTLNRLEQAMDALEHANMVDDLTGLENARALQVSFDRYNAMARRREVAFLVTVWNLDDLRGTIEREGRLAGDARLTAFARILQARARADDAVFRVGEDEFVGLHLGLEDGNLMVSRVSEQDSQVTAGWALVETGSLDDALMQAALMIRQQRNRAAGEKPLN